MAYEFKGYDWMELAECWGIAFTEDDEEEVVAEKIKKHIFEKLGDEEFKSIREDMERFLKALIKESKELDYNYPAFEGILKIKDDFTFAKWFCRNLEAMWT